MNRLQITVLLLSSILLGAAATPRNLRDGISAEAREHQRILAELEEIHSLRERMLQEGAVAWPLLLPRANPVHVSGSHEA